MPQWTEKADVLQAKLKMWPHQAQLVFCDIRTSPAVYLVLKLFPEM